VEFVSAHPGLKSFTAFAVAQTTHRGHTAHA